MKENNALEEDKKENINLFSDIIDQKKLSKYSNQLNKVFSNYSYSNFIKDLTKINKEKKQMTFKDQINQWLNLTNFSTKFHLDIFNIKDFKLKLKEIEQKNLLSLEKRKNKYIDKRYYKRKLLSQLTANKILKIKNKNQLLQKPCIGVYNPQYDSIGKHCFQVIFAKKNFDDFNKDNNLEKTRSYFDIKSKTIYSNRKVDKQLKDFEKSINKTDTQIKSFKKNKTNSNHKRIKVKNVNNLNINNVQKKKINLNIILNRNKVKNNITKIFNINEDLLFFPKLKRKKRNKNNNENLLLNSNNTFKNTFYRSTLNNNNNTNLTIRDSSSIFKIKGYVDFDKSSKKIICYFDEIAKQKKSPSVGTYHPCYSSIYERTTNIFFPIKKSLKKEKSVNKKLINKVIRNYNQTIQYELFDSLNKKIYK